MGLDKLRCGVRKVPCSFQYACHFVSTGAKGYDVVAVAVASGAVIVVVVVVAVHASFLPLLLVDRKRRDADTEETEDLRPAVTNG